MVRASTSFAVVLSAVTSLVAVGCADDAGDGALRIIRNSFVDEESCVVSPTSTTSLSSGRIEAASPIDYQLSPVVQNYAVSASGKYTAQRTAFLEGARVDITFADPTFFTAAEIAQMQADGITKFTSPFAATVTPDNGTSGMVFSVVPVELLRKIQPKLTATTPSTIVITKLRVFGQMGGSEVEGEPFSFPVTVCDFTKGPCVIATVANGCGGIANPRLGNPCNAFQEGPVDCCNNGTSVICPSPKSSALTELVAPAEHVAN